MDLPREVPISPTIFRSSWVRWAEMVVWGLVAIAVGWLLFVTTTTSSNRAPTFPVVCAIGSGVLSVLLGLHHFIRRSPDVTVDDQGMTLSPFGRIPWAGISRIHLITSHSRRHLSVELVEPKPKLTESAWPRWIYGPLGKFWIGYPLTLSERWLRPTSLDDIADELHRRNPGLVITRSERKGF
ncbi:hypothetical protein [Nocardia sp. NBC_01327]|uniref:hypothetical protein n=1 Tax=Nocardia sp. NBC_01327 TaxID=2903593 RepID=UPI002E0F20D7|nr:hypothetical protein OG326_33195 [Nocardia sp. NBC_01327]